MIIWSGRGFLIALVLFASLFAGFYFLPKESSDYGFVFAAFLTGFFSWAFGRKWNRADNRVFIDEKTGQRFRIKNNHTLFWIPMQYWGIILPILGIVILFQNSTLIAVIATIILVGIIIFQFNRNKTKKPISNHGNLQTSPKRNKKTEVEIEQNKPDSFEDREKRRKEKEDPSRFMPK
ncbi:hypothetical protein [Galbibacter pacificus]|uniref:Uncharacterized protein n=1 Tax=Galbibacter pacificus TaxID=2996052 RepID=A0ABT6FTV1_9FLAO|nr:hypothetical protein [Galbibacter pacificus]MDG3583212.1 hypothetical protein [Galbibacter pacificus]MDG3586693.1 hypothetical protein [Galbibacter pacificus]